MNKPHVLEIVKFKLSPDLSLEKWETVVKESGALLATCDGFKGRKLLLSADREVWIDMVFWNTPEDSRMAMERLAKHPSLDALFTQLTDVNMHHVKQLPVLDARRDADATETANAADADEQAASGQPAYECVSYRLKEGADPTVFRDMLARIGSVITRYAGFVSRSVYLDEENGTWTELLQFRSMEAVQAIAATLMAEPEMLSLRSLIEESSVSMIFATEVPSES